MTDSPSDARETDGPPEASSVEWFADLLEPLAALAIARGVGLQTLLDSLKLALVRAAVAADARQPGTGRARLSDSRVSMMTGVHRKDLRRLRQRGPSALGRGHSVANAVFTCWLSGAAWLDEAGEPRDLLRLGGGAAADSFEALVNSVTRDVHHRAVLDELLRLRLVTLVGEGDSNERVRVVQRAFVPAADAPEALEFARSNLADHVAAITGNLDGEGRRFLEQAIFSDGLTAETARRFNLQTREVWQQVFARMMPMLQALYEADQQSDAARDHRVRLGMYSYAGADDRPVDDPYRQQPEQG